MIYSILIWFSVFSPPDKDKIVADFSVAVYPNPTTGIFQVEIRGATKEVELRLYNMSGNLSIEHHLSKMPVYTTLSLGSDNLEHGIYSLVILLSDGQQMVKRILVIDD